MHIFTKHVRIYVTKYSEVSMHNFKWMILSALLVLTFLLTGCGTKNPGEDEATETELVEIKNGLALPGYYYENNLADNAADPFILYADGTYYLYCTGGSRFSVRQTDYLSIFPTESKVVLELSSLSWARDNGWAPEVYAHGGMYYMIFSARGNNDLYAIDIAVSNTPDGKFVPLSTKPFFAPDYSVIDASLFFDDDGRIYMYYSKDNSTNTVNGKRTSQTYGIEIKKDFSGVIGEPVLISTPEQNWELKSGSVLWNEGPVVFKENGIYYLLYSANYYVSEHYAVGYATSTVPLAKFEKPKNARILCGNGDTVTGPGHCNILRSPDGSELYMVYHVHTVPPDTKNGRSLALDRLVIRADGSLAVDGPSETRRPLPSGVNGYFHIQDGFTAIGEGEKAEFSSLSSVEALFDGIAKASFEGIYSMGEGGNVTITLDTPTALTALMIYAPTLEEYVPATVDVEINGSYILRGLKSSSLLGNPITATLSGLPEGTKVETVKITVHLAEGKNYAALSEIVMITAREKK